MKKLGVIGMSEGNGHPYSWSAIFNGYDRQIMQSCPFPAIPAYLSQREYPQDFIQSARVTHVWTQDAAISSHIAGAAKIDKVCERLEDMLGEVDGVLLARDDFQNHETFADVFLSQGIPIFIDKPLANDVSAAKKLLGCQMYEGQIFTCSAFRYALELQALPKKPIQSIKGVTLKTWSRYSIHIIEPLVTLLYPQCGEQKVTRLDLTRGDQDSVLLRARWGTVDVTLQATGENIGSIGLEITYDNETKCKIEFKDTFYAFRESLRMFLNQMEARDAMIPRQQTLKCMEWVEQGHG